MKTRYALAALGIALAGATANAEGPHLVFQTSGTDGDHVVEISNLSRVNFVTDGLDVVGTSTRHIPYSELLRMTVDHEGLTNPTAISTVTAESAAIRVTPSPAVDVVSIEGLTEAEDILIYSTSGSLVGYVKDYAGGTIDVSSLAGGVYIVKTKNATAKFFKL